MRKEAPIMILNFSNLVHTAERRKSVHHSSNEHSNSHVNKLAAWLRVIRSERVLDVCLFSSSKGAPKWSTFLISLSFLVALLNVSSKTLVHAQSCLGDHGTRFEFDQAMFDELNMEETLLMWYRSCYKDDLDNVRKEAAKNIKFTECNSSSSNQAPSSSQIKKYTIDKILYQLFKQDTFLLASFVNTLNQVCENKNEDNDVERLFLLANYSHALCGYVFRNSMKLSHLHNYVLRGRFRTNSSSDERSIENNTVPSSKNVKREFAEVEFEYSSDFDDDDDLMSRANVPVRESIKIHRSVQFQNGTPHRFATSLAATSSTFIVLNGKGYGMTTTQTAPVKDHKRPTPIANTKPTTSTARKKESSPTTNSLSSNSSILLPSKTVITKHLNNCTLILLNIYLLVYKSTCNYEDFIDTLNHYDCLKNNFSVKSNCSNCKEAYKNWLCSSNIPYYKNENLVKPCLRYCYTVQNQCPFFRPVDMYGGQPVFHCRNVVQVNEWRPDGYEDDDENYVEDNPNDEDACYAQCVVSTTAATAAADMSMPQTSATITSSSVVSSEPIRVDLDELIFQVSKNASSQRHYSGRSSHTQECLFNAKSNSPRFSSSTSNQLFVLFLFLYVFTRSALHS